MKKHWFVPKMFGWGFVPVSIEGWLATFGLLFVVWGWGWLVGIFEEEVGFDSGVIFLVGFVLILVVASKFFAGKTKGKVRWRWGK